MQAHIKKRNIYVGCDITRKVHCRNVKRDGAGKHYRFLTDIKSLILLVRKLCEIVDKTDRAANQYKKHGVKQTVIIGKKTANTQNERNRNNRNHKNYSACGGRTLL